MASGRKLTEADKWTVLRMNHDGVMYDRIAKQCGLHRRTIQAILKEAAAIYYEQNKPNRLDDLVDGPTA